MQSQQRSFAKIEFRHAFGVLCIFIVVSMIHFQSTDYWFLIKSIHVDIPPGQIISKNQVIKKVIEAIEVLDVKTKAPHIVMIVADDLGWNDISWHNPLVKSPNLENLAKSGIILEQYYAQHICTPSRGALLTGRLDIANLGKVAYHVITGILFILD